MSGRAKRTEHRVQYASEEHAVNFRVSLAVDKAVSAMAHSCRALLVARYYRRWVLRASMVSRKDHLLGEAFAARLSSMSSSPAPPAPSSSSSCTSCGNAPNAIAELRALAGRLHHRVAQRDRLIAYYASQRDATVRWSDRVVHAAMLTQHQYADPSASMFNQSVLIAPPPPPPPPHPTLLASREDTSSPPRPAPVVSPLMALLAIPVPVETELRSRIAALEARLLSLGDDPRSVVWPKRSVAQSDVLRRKSTAAVATSGGNPSRVAAATTVEAPIETGASKGSSAFAASATVATAATAASARRSQSAVQYSATGRRNTVAPNVSIVASPCTTESVITSPLSPQPMPPPAEPMAAWVAASPTSFAAPSHNTAAAAASSAVDSGAAISTDAHTPASVSDSIDEEDPGEAPEEVHSAHRIVSGGGAVTSSRGVVRRYEATAVLSALDGEPLAATTTPNGNGRSVDPSWPVAPNTNGSNARPLRLHRVPAEMLQILQPAPIHNRGFAPSQAPRVALTVKRTGAAMATAAAQQQMQQQARANSGQNRSETFRVVPQRQPGIAVAPANGTGPAKKVVSRGS